MRAYRIWLVALAANLAAVACGGETDGEPVDAGGMGGEGAHASGGGPGSGGAATGGLGGLGGASGGGTMPVGGSGGTPPDDMWPPPTEALAGTLEELEGMDCVIELDEGDDGDVDRRWGVDYVAGQVARKLMWAPDDAAPAGVVTVVSMNEAGEPWLTCWPGGCDLITTPPYPSTLEVPCVEGSALTGPRTVYVDRYSNPPGADDLVPRAQFRLTEDGVPTRATFDFSDEWDDESERHCFFPDGTLSGCSYEGQGETAYETDTWEFHPNQQVARSLQAYTDDTDLSTRDEWFCNSDGWVTSSSHLSDDGGYEHTSETTYATDADVGGAGGLGGAPSDAGLVAYTTLIFDEWREDLVEVEVLSSIEEAADGLTFDIAATTEEGGWTDTFSAERHVGRPHVVERVFDSGGRLVSEGVDISVDGAVDLINTYSYTEGCLAGKNPQLDFVPYTKEKRSEWPVACPFSPFPVDGWSRPIMPPWDP